MSEYSIATINNFEIGKISYSEIIGKYEIVMSERDYDYWSSLDYFRQQSVITYFNNKITDISDRIEVAHPTYCTDFEKKLEMLSFLSDNAKYQPLKIQRVYNNIDNKLYRHEFIYYETYFRRYVYLLELVKDGIKYNFFDVITKNFDDYEKTSEMIIDGEIIIIPTFNVSEIFSLALNNTKKKITDIENPLFTSSYKYY
jgi:hypothetical protein